MSPRAEALDRTLVLMRSHIRPDVSDDVLLSGLTDFQVAVVADRANSTTHAGQSVIVTMALLCVRMGMNVMVTCDNVPLVGPQPPLKCTHLLDALTDVGHDLIPGSSISAGSGMGAAQISVLVGDTPSSLAPSSRQVVRLCGGRWDASLMPSNFAGLPWATHDVPFGAMAGAALGAGEAFKAVMLSMRKSSSIPIGIFDDQFAPSLRARVELAPASTGCPSVLGDMDFISGGAVTHAALYSILRIRDASGRARMIEPQTYDLSNLNRYSLMRRSNAGAGKATHLAGLSTPAFTIDPIPERYDAQLQDVLGGLANNVLVGVDHIPSRWLAQQNCSGWLGCGATEQYNTVTSFHSSRLPCVACLHPTDSGVDPRAPTVSFVSFWAGLWLAALLIRQVADQSPPPNEQAVWTSMLRSDAGHAVLRRPVQRHAECRLSCSRVAV